jgi:hypothetical protein
MRAPAEKRATSYREGALTACLALALGAVGVEAANAQAVGTDTADAPARGAMSTGVYVGELYKSEFISLFYRPQAIDLTPSYLVAVNANYRLYRWSSLPLQFEGEFDVAKRFAGADQVEFDLAPFVRWTAFPWNDTLYTNFRLGGLGLSYATSISAWERQNSGNNTGSRLQHFLVPELTFSAGPQSRSEAFIRVHHRSGVFGLFHGVYGGSNYLSVGYRVFW